MLLDFRKAVQPGSSGQMPPPQAKDQSIHATADLDLENDPRTKHKVERCLSPSVHPSPSGTSPPLRPALPRRAS